MEENFYNDESKYGELIDLLKGLPKVDTPDNFEYNLMTKINNGNFDLNTKETNFFLGRYFLPATGLVGIFIIIFFVLSDPTAEEINPFLQEPPVLKELSASASSPKIINDVIIAQKPVESVYHKKGIVSSDKAKNSKSKKALRVVVKPNDVISEEVVDLPFDPSKSVSVDEKIAEKTSVSTTNRRSALVGGASNGFGFDGFYIRERIDRKYLEAWKAKLDSIKRAQRLRYQMK